MGRSLKVLGDIYERRQDYAGRFTAKRDSKFDLTMRTGSKRSTYGNI